jgi:hypothetical protein
MTRNPAHSPHSSSLFSILFAIAVSGAASSAPAQSLLTFDSRNGANGAFCGLPTGGPGILHRFTTPVPTQDIIAVSDPGNGDPARPSSAATSQIDATPTASSFSITMAGSATRAARSPAEFGVNATADVRDEWILTVNAPVRFALSVKLGAACTEATVSPVSFFVAPRGAGASIVPDAGTPPPPYGSALTTPGTFALTASGKLTPGQYVISLNGRTESNFNSYPFSGSFDGSIAFDVYVPIAAAVTTRNAGSNPASYGCGLPILGQTWNASVDLSTTGHDFAVLFGSQFPAAFTIPGGPTLLLGGALFQLSPPLPGPHATHALNLPLTVGFQGVVVPTQAVHFGGAPFFALSNAQDLTLGF